MSMNRKCPDETALLRTLIRTLAVRTIHKIFFHIEHIIMIYCFNLLCVGVYMFNLVVLRISGLLFVVDESLAVSLLVFSLALILNIPSENALYSMQLLSFSPVHTLA